MPLVKTCLGKVLAEDCIKCRDRKEDYKAVSMCRFVVYLVFALKLGRDYCEKNHSTKEAID